jgi:tRNA (cmo5U34)-methyltransferase
MEPLEKMGDFFNARVDEYEQHILQAIAGGADYVKIAQLIPPASGIKLLDLGCGTGLELDEIFKVNPGIFVTGIDMAGMMLEKLKLKHIDRAGRLNLITADYFKYNLGKEIYDIALSVQTLHHFTHKEKTGLYKKIHESLKPSGFYVEGDYVAPTQEFEDFHFAEKKRIFAEQKLNREPHHYDTPCTVENQVMLLKKSGFSSIEKIWERKNFAILKANG